MSNFLIHRNHILIILMIIKWSLQLFLHFHPNIIYCLCVLVLGEKVYDFKTSSSVEDHEFTNPWFVTQICYTNPNIQLQYWKKNHIWWQKYQIFPFPKERQHCIPPWIGKQATEVFSLLCWLLSHFIEQKEVRRKFSSKLKWKGGIPALWWLSSPQSLQPGWNLPSFSRRNKSGQDRRSYDQSINLRGCVWGLSREPNP